MKEALSAVARNNHNSKSSNISIWLLILCNLLLLQISHYVPIVSVLTYKDYSESSDKALLTLLEQPQSQQVEEQTLAKWNLLDPLQIPQGSPPNLPSIRDTSADAARSIYGGVGDKKHLGGFTEIDMMGISPSVFKYMMTALNVHSFLDVGCGRGISTRWFLEHGVDVLCVEGSHDALQQSFLPSNLTVEHDFSRGPWWPAKTYDAVWSVEFLEHVSRHYHFNYMQTFRKAAIIFATSSRWGGWHHVEVHTDDWWVLKFESFGFRYTEVLTKRIRNIAKLEAGNETLQGLGPTGKAYYGQHIFTSMKVFINPAVAALPEHNHLFFEHGCFEDFNGGAIINRPCKDEGIESALPESYMPLPLTAEQDEAWVNAIKAGIKIVEEQTSGNQEK